MIKVRNSVIRRMVFCFLPIILLSCKNGNSIVDNKSIFIADLDSVCTTSEFKYSELFKTVTAVILDNEEAVLFEINKMLVHKDRLYLLDCRSQGVYAFQKSGNFICKYGNLGAGPGEYISCKDFAINSDAGEIYVYDMLKSKIHKYDISSGLHKGSMQIDKSINLDYITYNSGYIYGAQTYNRNEGGKKPYYLLYQIDIDSGKKISQRLDAASCNKGWNDEFMHGNIFYNLRENEDLFVLGLMDTIMCIKEREIFPFLAIEGEQIMKKEDVLDEERIPSSNPRIRTKRMMSLLARLSARNKIYQISNVFEHNDILYFNCMGKVSYFVQYDENKRATFTYSRTKNDILFQMIPEHFQLPNFLCADERGVYYCIPNDNLSELKYFVDEDYISGKLINRGNIKNLNEESNPIILYYEYKE